MATVHGDGVVVYDCDAQTKTRSGRWAGARPPAGGVRELRTTPAALLPPGGRIPALVTWTDAVPPPSTRQWTRAPPGCPAGDPRLVAVGGRRRRRDRGCGSAAPWFGRTPGSSPPRAPGRGGGVTPSTKNRLRARGAETSRSNLRRRRRGVTMNDPNAQTHRHHVQGSGASTRGA